MLEDRIYCICHNINMNIELLTNKYTVKKLGINDCDNILALYKSNPHYFEYCPPFPTIDTVKDDLSILPNGIDISNKYFLGFYDNDQLIGIIDLITNYPDNEACFIGLFMIDSKYQGKRIGSILIEDICCCLKEDYKYIRLAYAINNTKAKEFWNKNKFVPIKQTNTYNDNLEVMLCIRQL